MLVVYGTRPELIKLAPVIHQLRRESPRFEVTVCSTAQHREMIEDLERLFEIRPDHDLDLMRPNQALNELTARALRRADALLGELRPDWTVVQGDTTTAMATALAAFHQGLRVAHVEAGLRTGDLTAPFPEEANRRIIDLTGDLLLAPTSRAEEALLLEGCDPQKIVVTGNTVIDALQWVSTSMPDEPPANEVLVTVHRRESFGEPLLEILAALEELATRFCETRWILPVHLNPNVGPVVRERLGGIENVRLEPPMRYDTLVRHLRRARFVLTDSGGLQEEAPTFGKPVLVLRDKTERPEGVEAGVARLVGTGRERIVEGATQLLEDEDAYRRMATPASPYGDGRAARRIAQALGGTQVESFRHGH